MPRIKRDMVVRAQGHTGTFKVLVVSEDDKRANIQSFNVSKQLLVGPVLNNIPVSTLTIYKEDSSQAALRVVREATEDK